MAHGRPYYPRYGGDFIAGTVGMDLETRGAYSLIIDYLNDRDRALPDDDRFVAGLLGVSTRKWRSIRDTLLADPTKLVVDDRGDLTNPRFERERSERHAALQRAAENGRAGGKKSAAKRAENAQLGDGSTSVQPRFGFENETNPQPTHDEPQPETPENNDLAEAPPQARARVESRDQSPEDRKTPPAASNPEPAKPIDDDDGKPTDLTARTARFARLGGVALNPAYPKPYTRELDVVKAWTADGIPDDVIAETIAAELERTSEPSIASLKFYDGAIRKAVAFKAAKDGGRKSPRKAGKPVAPLAETDSDDPRIVRIREDLKAAIGPGLYGSWLAPRDVALQLNGVGLVVRARSAFNASYLESNYLDQIDKLARKHGIEGARIKG